MEISDTVIHNTFMTYMMYESVERPWIKPWIFMSFRFYQLKGRNSTVFLHTVVSV